MTPFYIALTLVFAVFHHFWTCKLRHRLAEYIVGYIPRLSIEWGYHVQNWFVRVLLPLAIVLSRGGDPEVLGFKLPYLTVEVFSMVLLLTVALFLITTIIVWFAISISKDPTVIETVKNWPKKPSLKKSLAGILLWTFPEECFLRGYLISQFMEFNSTIAILISTFFTSILHKSRGKFWITLSIFTGLIFGLTYIWTYSLLPPLIVHSICNEIFPLILTSWTKKLSQET
ncbi:MAG: CPBP family intramembrane glutamic endopeptidase [Candidatus Bathyarchaeia archaeon]